MIIGSEFSKKNKSFLITIGRLSKGDPERKILVLDINSHLELDRTEIKNVLEYLQELGYIKIKTIGGPLLYGHVTITQQGLEKYHQIQQDTGI